MQTIAVGANTYTLVAMPAKPGFAEVAFGMTDSVSAVTSPFTMQTQTQAWPGADMWTAQFTLPPLTFQASRAWLAFLAGLRGRLNVFQAGDPYAARPQGTGAGAPVVDGSVGTNNAAMATTLYTRGWLPSRFGVLLPGDNLQIGYRLHMVAGDARVNSDSTGAANFPIFPSLREQPADGAAIVLSNPKGLFRLPQNKRGWHSSPSMLVQTGFDGEEVR